MSTQARCHCQGCTMRSMTGPAIVITIGVLFLLHQAHGGNLDFGNTWPVILVVVGFLYLVSSLASREGHIDTAPTPVPPTTTAPPPSPQPPYSNQDNS
jgi:LiaI-LiaF-like transmembrane region